MLRTCEFQQGWLWDQVFYSGPHGCVVPTVSQRLAVVRRAPNKACVLRVTTIVVVAGHDNMAVVWYDTTRTSMGHETRWQRGLIFKTLIFYAFRFEAMFSYMFEDYIRHWAIHYGLMSNSKVPLIVDVVMICYTIRSAASGLVLLCTLVVSFPAGYMVFLLVAHCYYWSLVVTPGCMSVTAGSSRFVLALQTVSIGCVTFLLVVCAG
ncbi:hypothetical protein Tco_0586832 [Tanacetum coccineum]